VSHLANLRERAIKSRLKECYLFKSCNSSLAQTAVCCALFLFLPLPFVVAPRSLPKVVYVKANPKKREREQTKGVERRGGESAKGCREKETAGQLASMSHKFKQFVFVVKL